MSAREAYRQYREAVTACKGIFARGGNVTGDYGEHLVKQLYGGELLPSSHKSTDVRLGDGTLLADLLKQPLNRCESCWRKVYHQQRYRIG